MTACPHCLEEIKPGARRCPHCQSDLVENTSESGTVYVLDRGLVKFAKFSVGILAIFVIVGVYIYGTDLKEIADSVNKSQDEVEAIAKEIASQKSKIDQDMLALRTTLSDVQSAAAAMKAEIAKAGEDAQTYIRGQVALVGLDEPLTDAEANALITGASGQEFARPGSKLWKNGSALTYRFIGGEEGQRQIVRDAIVEWTTFANLTFSEVAGGEAILRFSFDPNRGSWSKVGTDALGLNGAATTNFGQASVTPTGRKTVLHELGHVLGFYHEFQNPLAGELFDEEAVKSVMRGPPNFWSESQINQSLFKKTENAFPTAYDPLSVMNYTLPQSFFLDATRVANPGPNLSEGDKERASLSYPR